MKRKKICLVALYNSDWQWALILEYALDARERNEDVEVLDLTGIGCTNLGEILRFYYAEGKFYFKARRYLESNGIHVTRPGLSLIKILWSLQYLARTNARNKTVTNSIKSSVSDKISKQSPKSISEKLIFKNEFRAGFEFERYIETIEFAQDALYVIVNGRFSKSKLLLNTLQSHGNQFRILEFGNSPSSIQVFEKSPHNLSEHENEMTKLWNRAQPAERSKIADKYFQRMRFFDPVASFNWTKNMQTGNLPTGFDPTSNNIVFFTSSNLELLVLEHDSKEIFFENQQDAVEALFEVFSSLGWNLYLRLHPTREIFSDANADEISWVKLSEKYNATLIEGSSSVDSFALAHGSQVAAHFNSSIGPQLIYENHPGLITLGPTFWKTLATKSHIQNKDQLLKYVHDQMWTKKIYSSADILPWAFYRATRGENFKFVIYDPDIALWDISVSNL